MCSKKDSLLLCQDRFTGAGGGAGVTGGIIWCALSVELPGFLLFPLKVHFKPHTRQFHTL